jgi:hypothetical protein
LAVASSVACIVALFVSMLGLARSLFNVTWSPGELGEDQICLQIGQAESEQFCLQVGQAGSDSPASKWLRTAASLTGRSPRAQAGLGPTATPMRMGSSLVASGTLSTTVQVTAQAVSAAPTVKTKARAVSPTPTVPLFQAPSLLSPEPDAQLQSVVHFEWHWEGQSLPEGLSFDLLIWSEAEEQEHQGTGAYGVIETDLSMERDVDLDFVQTIMDHGEGTYYWTVIVVQEEPYGRVGAWGEKRSFTYVDPEPATGSSNKSP